MLPASRGAGNGRESTAINGELHELMETESEAVPKRRRYRETLAPLAGEVMATAGVGEATLIDKLFEAVSAEASLTCAEKVKEPAREGVPEIIRQN